MSKLSQQPPRPRRLGPLPPYPRQLAAGAAIAAFALCGCATGGVTGPSHAPGGSPANAGPANGPAAPAQTTMIATDPSATPPEPEPILDGDVAPAFEPGK